MKMLTAIINKNDEDIVCDALREEGFTFTKMASTGGFLRSGNTTLLMGTEDDKVDLALQIIRKNCEKRVVPMAVPIVRDGMNPLFLHSAAQVMVGGATVFVTAVEKFEKM